MRFIHTADLHLDSPFQGLKVMPPSLWERVHSSTFKAWQAIVDDAINLPVDFVLISGDIYDRDQQSIAATDFFIQQCQRLAAAKIPVYLLYGNHDYQLVQGHSDLPANVHVFPNQVTTYHLTLSNHETVAITGFSYDQRWLNDDQLSQYPPKATTTWQIGMLHGALHQQGATDHYAPFTIAELQAKNYDYWALGHIHKHQLLATKPPIVYCGNPQGRHKNEVGQHGYYLVESHGKQLIPHFKPVAKIEWRQLTIDLPVVNNLTALEQQVIKLVEQAVQPPFQLVSLTVTGFHKLNSKIQHLIANGEFLAHLQDQTSHNNHWWIYELAIDQPSNMPTMADLDQQYWQQAADQLFTSATILDLGANLAKERYLAERLTALDPQVLKKRATKLLQQGGRTDED